MGLCKFGQGESIETVRQLTHVGPICRMAAYELFQNLTLRLNSDSGIEFAKKASCVVVVAIGIYGLKQYMRGGVCRSKARLDGKVVIITGANAGIGKETTKDLLRRGAKVYLGCRSRERAEKAIQEIQKETGVSDDKLSLIILDLASLKSVREFVREFTLKETRLDILINNAGVVWTKQRKTEDGFDFTFGANYLGHFLLTHLLMGVISAANSCRVINVSSLAHKDGKIDFEDLTLEKNYNIWTAYGQSKLANVLFTRELASRLKGTNITTYSLHPGAVNTDIQREAPFFNNFFVKNILLIIFWPFIKSSVDGAQTTIYCAVDEKLANESGKYYSDCKEKKPAAVAQDDATAKRLWDVSIQLVKLEPSEIHPKLK